MTRGSPRGGHDRWLVSYADLVTLLFAFFTVMYAASTVDADKLGPLASSLEQAFGTAPHAPVDRPGARPTIVPPVEVVPRDSNLSEIRIRLTEALAEDLRLRRVEITRDGRGLIISLPERATFAEGSAAVTADARVLIERIVAPLRELPNAIRIEGHTDDVPIRTSVYASNWELSTARAGGVVAWLVTAVRIEPARLSAAGYGEFHPRVPNDGAENRARNRRIDIVILDAPPGPRRAEG